MQRLEVLFSPAEFKALEERDLSRAVCVVFDVLRASTSMITALHNGAESVLPVLDIPEALALRKRNARLLLAGERDGLRIAGKQANGVEFDLGNSPREFTAERVKGRMIAMTTTNGTIALRACAHARRVLVGGFVNFAATMARLREDRPKEVLLVCAGTHRDAAFEDTLAAGAVCDEIWDSLSEAEVADSAEIARHIYRAYASDLFGAMRHSRNGRRLLAIPDLSPDVMVCLDRNSVPLAVELTDGRVCRIGK